MEAKVDHPVFPKGEPLDVGFGLVDNGSTVEVTEEDELRYYARFGVTMQDAFKDNPVVSLSGQGKSKPSSLVSDQMEAEGISSEPTPEDREQQASAMEAGDATDATGLVPVGDTDTKEGGDK